MTATAPLALVRPLPPARSQDRPAPTSAARLQAELLRLLECELRYLDAGGYNWSWRPRWLVIDSPICPWRGEPETRESCRRCPLMALAPLGPLPAGIPCHQIVISPQGETIDGITRLGDHRRLHRTYRAWLLQQMEQLALATGVGHAA